MPQEPSASTIALAPSTEVTPLGLKLPEQMSLEEWEVLGAYLRTITDGVQWAIGDWLVYGEGREEWGHMYERAEKILGIANATLRKYAQASARWHPCRRRYNLSWSHHYELCALEDNEQEQWAEAAEEHQLPKHRLRRSIAAGRVLTPEESARSGKRGLPTFAYFVKEIVKLERKYDDESTWDKATVDVLEAELRDLEPVVRVADRLKQMIAQRTAS